MRKKWQFIFIGLVLGGLFLSACAPVTPEAGPIPTQALEGTLRPYPSDTPTVTPLPTDYVSPTPSPTITPTATQVVYEVQLGDDMYSIAFRYGLEPQAVMTANPEVDPRAMTVGMSLLIPVTPAPPATATPTSAVEITPTPTSAATVLQTPDCYPDALGGLWCFLLVTNDADTARENISALVTLTAGDEIRQQTAIMPLNLLPAGEAQPLIAYFQAPLPSNYFVSAEIDFFLPVMPDDQRYLQVNSQDTSVTFSDDREIATLSGILSLSTDQRDAGYVWVSATALDAEGRVVAVRRWDADGQLIAGGELFFEVSLYSLSGPIDRVTWLAEAQPVPDAAESE